MSLSDEDVRHMVIEILTEETDRDRQVLIGASDISNGCDYCLASAMLGISRETDIASRPWGGRVNGTAVHGEIQRRLDRMLAEGKHDIAKRYPDALVEFNMLLGYLESYGNVRTTSDLVLPCERHAFDWKGTDKAKLAVLIDFLAIQSGETAPYGRTHQVHKAKTLSEKVYAEKMLDMEFKVTGYYDQLQLYGLGLERNGIPVDRLSIVFIARDDTMFFDNPAMDRYDDPKALHGTHVLSFNYNREYALAVWERAVTIWERIQAGETPSDFNRHAQCFPCGIDGQAVINAQAIADRIDVPVPMNDIIFDVLDAELAELLDNANNH